MSAGAAENRVLRLQGAGDFVELPTGVLGDLTNATIEAWVMWENLDGENKRVFNYGSAWRDVSLCARNDGELWFVFPEDRGNVHQISTRAIVTTNTWYHLAASLGSGMMQLYLNGWHLDTDSYTGGFDKTLPTARFRFGETVSIGDAPAAFRGMIDEVRLWDRALKLEEIHANMHRRLRGDEPGLVGLWNFDEETARDSGKNAWHGKFQGKARAVTASIPDRIGIDQFYLDLRVREGNEQPAKSVILEAMAGTNVVHARFSKDGVFKMILPAVDGSLTFRASTLFANGLIETNISRGSQPQLRIVLPAANATAENTNQFAAAMNNVLKIDPTTLERLDPTLMRQLSPLLQASEENILSLFESPDPARRRFITMFLEKFDHSSVKMVTALARARHDRDELVRGLAQRSLQSLPVPPELQAVYTKRELATAGLFAGLLIPFALIHFFLFVLNPARPSNLYYGLFAAAGALMIYFGGGGSDLAWAQTTSLAFMSLGLLALYSLFYERRPWTFWVVMVVVWAAVAAVWRYREAIGGFSSIQLGGNSASANFPAGALMALVGSYLALTVVVLDLLRVVMLSVFRRKQGAWLVGTGFLILVVAGIIRYSLYFALFAGKISADTFARYIIYFPGTGAAGFVICGSIYLARSFSRSFAEVQSTKVEIEKKNAELMITRDAALSASQTKSQFLANMSHELRTPLNAIIGYSELMAEVAQEEGHKQYTADLEKVIGAAKHQLMLVNDILDLSKIEAGKMTMTLEDFDVKTMIQEIRDVLAPVVAKKRNRLDIEIPGALGAMHSDETKVRQVLFNLLSNAAKFTEDGVITLRVTEQLANGVVSIAFVVADTGIGMTAEQTSKLFQPFTQAEAGIHLKYGGTGLGLVISKRFCEMLGGTLAMRSEFGRGSTFIATLPQRTPEISP